MSEEPIVAWFNTFPTVSVAVGDLMDLKDGVALLEAFSEIDTMVDLDTIKRDVGDSWPMGAKNIRTCASHIESFYREELAEAADLSYIDADAIAQGKSAEGIQDLCELVLGCLMKCGDNQTFISRILDMEEDLQGELQTLVQGVMGRFPPLDDDAGESDDGGTTPPTIRSSSAASNDSPAPAAQDDDDVDEDDTFGVSTEESMRQLERIEELTTQNTLQREESRRVSAMNETMQEELDRLREESEQKRSTNDAAEWRVRELENDKQEKDAEIETLKRQLTRKDQDLSKMQDELDVLRSKAKKADAAERARRTFEDQMRRMEQKVQQHAEVRVKLGAVEQERDGLRQQKEDLQEKLRRSDDKLRKITAERDQVESDLAAAAGQVRRCARVLASATVRAALSLNCASTSARRPCSS
jgi:uncharacterized coiled-coil protein SlyX